MLIGGSTDRAEDRRVGWNLRRLGWPGFVQTRVRPQLDAGVRRIQLHNPFGALPDEPMQFDQFLHARDAGLDFLTEDFVEAWKPVVDGDYTDGEPVEVIAYLGKLPGDPDFEAFLEKGDEGGWRERAERSMALPLEVGMSLGFDAVAEQGEDSPTCRLIRDLQARGVRIYIEARPPKDAPHWFAQPIIITDRFWKRSDPDRYPQDSGRWAVRNEKLSGEIVRIVDSPPYSDAMNCLPDIRAILADGHTAAAPLYLMLKQGVNLERLMRPEPE